MPPRLSLCSVRMRQRARSSTIAPRARRSTNALDSRPNAPRKSALVTAAPLRMIRNRVAPPNDPGVRFPPVKSASVRTAHRSSPEGKPHPALPRDDPAGAPGRVAHAGVDPNLACDLTRVHEHSRGTSRWLGLE
jgi:hypothetical protein